MNEAYPETMAIVSNLIRISENAIGDNTTTAIIKQAADRLAALEGTRLLHEHQLKGYTEVLTATRAERDREMKWRLTLQQWGGTPEIVEGFIKGQQARIDAAMAVENGGQQ